LRTIGGYISPNNLLDFRDMLQSNLLIVKESNQIFQNHVEVGQEVLFESAKKLLDSDWGNSFMKSEVVMYEPASACAEVYLIFIIKQLDHEKQGNYSCIRPFGKAPTSL